jgi:tyrosyl-tRNA synthetase
MFSVFKSQPNVIVDEAKVETLLTRGVERHYPSQDFLRERLLSGKRLSVYLGIDPTGPTLHLGHTIPLRKLRQFQELGHKVILLIGDFTARIGDPDQKEARKPLTRKEVLQNARLYKKQASAILDFKGANPAEIKFNNDWLSKLTFADVLELASHMTVQEMLKRDMFQERVKRERPIYVHEFLYPLMQGYDSVAMDVDGEVGGNDQTFNMLAGRTLTKAIKRKEKFVIPMKLLIDPTGAKMGKTAGNMLSFLDTPEEKFGKVMHWPDGMILSGFELCTDEGLPEIEKRLASGENPRDIKRDLALEVVKTFDGKDAAKRARDAFEETFQRGEIPEEAPAVNAASGDFLRNILMKAKVVASHSDFRRLIDGGAVTDMENGEKVSDYDFAVHKTTTYKVGKRRFVKVLVL